MSSCALAPAHSGLNRSKPLALANLPPLAPVITEPTMTGQIVSPADVHMEIGPFSDPDPANLHDATQWEIWTAGGTPVIAWSFLVTNGVERVHTHLGDGTFVNNHSGRSELFADTDYQLRVRVRDNSGEAPTQWSTFAAQRLPHGATYTDAAAGSDRCDGVTRAYLAEHCWGKHRATRRRCTGASLAGVRNRRTAFPRAGTRRREQPDHQSAAIGRSRACASRCHGRFKRTKPSRFGSRVLR